MTELIVILLGAAFVGMAISGLSNRPPSMTMRDQDHNEAVNQAVWDEWLGRCIAETNAITAKEVEAEVVGFSEP